MQTEAGEGLASIVQRKEGERIAGGGLFCWGVGNAPSRSLAAYRGSDLDVVFSVMKSRPKAVDVSPEIKLVWKTYVDLDGVVRPLPNGARVTSRAARAHYVLICRSNTPLALGDFGPFDPRAYRNAGEGAKPIGASQVTALIRCVSDESPDTPYRINLRAKLVGWVKLGAPSLDDASPGGGAPFA
jgi:hypothetical protein